MYLHRAQVQRAVPRASTAPLRVVLHAGRGSQYEEAFEAGFVMDLLNVFDPSGLGRDGLGHRGFSDERRPTREASDAVPHAGNDSSTPCKDVGEDSSKTVLADVSGGCVG